MKTMNRIRSRIALLAVLMVGALVGAGCESAGVEPGGDPVATLASMDLVRSVDMTIENMGSGKEEAYVLEITLEPDARVRYPAAFQVFGMKDNGQVAILEDTGTGDDRVAGDLVYTARVDRSCLQDNQLQRLAGKETPKVTLTCEVDFISPGQECPGHGVCPETAERSFLWGLIEYEVDVVTCWCFQGCGLEIEFSS
ncbi:MAG: hypothetical protein O2899_06470 [Bacteroidetes bacterium]|nr:hypothetical protein [Bacteroidota bacterium]